MTAIGLTASLTGCQSTEGRAIAAAAATSVNDARTDLPDLPEDCRRHMGRVIPAASEKHTWTQKRWEYSADAIDRQIDDCAAWNDDTKREYAKRGK
jgi:hypothetical protein